jgi:hypothetical protein
MLDKDTADLLCSGAHVGGDCPSISKLVNVDAIWLRN